MIEVDNGGHSLISKLMHTTPTPLAALSALLISLFSGSELRNFLTVQEGGRGLLTQIPDGPVSLQDLVFRTITVLEQHGRLDAPFFEALVDAFPSRKASILSVAQAWHCSPVPRPCSIASASTGVNDFFIDHETGSLRSFFSY